MGSPKPLLEYHGRSFLQSILDKVAVLQLECSVVLGHNADKVLASHDLRDVAVVMNEELEAGPIGSIRAAIRTLAPQQVDALLVWPVDFPHVLANTAEALIDRFAEPDHPVIVLPECGGRSGHPVVFGHEVFPELLSAPENEGARFVVRQDPNRVARVAVRDPAILDSLNTPDSYRALLNRQGSKH